MLRKLAQVCVPFIWFGMIGAISFMEAPLKFQAPGITLPLGLGIGRLVFFVLNKIEIFLAAIFLISLFGGGTIGRKATIVFGIIVSIILLETLWLLPLLDARAEEVIAGTVEPYSSAHLFYIGLDAAKFVLLFLLGTLTFRRHLSGE